MAGIVDDRAGDDHGVGRGAEEVLVNFSLVADEFGIDDDHRLIIADADRQDQPLPDLAFLRLKAGITHKSRGLLARALAIDVEKCRCEWIVALRNQRAGQVALRDGLNGLADIHVNEVVTPR